ncbi:MAG: hypothetical protein K0S71_2328 [Clostridia bacterium]|jgi:hypothetical protein|nr:hypothetical protein [Clostridia bacterium]
MKKIAKHIIILIVMVMMMSTSVFAQEESNIQGNPNIQGYPGQRPIRYTQISFDTIRRNPDLARWYQRNYQREGIHYRKSRGNMYVIVSAGRKPTGGYTLIIRNIRRTQRNTAFIRARLIPPAPNMIVTQAITYPHLLIRIDDSRITRVEGVINEPRRGEQN